MKYKITGKWVGGGQWVSRDTYDSKEDAEAEMKLWQKNQASGEWNKSTMRIIEVTSPENQPA